MVKKATKMEKSHWRKLTVHRIVHYGQLCDAERRLGVRNGQKKYAFEFMKMNAGRFVKQGDLLEYCDKRRCEDTSGAKRTFKDNSRAIEALRKDKLPLEWAEVYRSGELWFKYAPTMKSVYTEEAMKKHIHKADSFTRSVVESQMEKAGYKCEITGIPVSYVGANADHFIPKEKGGQSVAENCVILGEHLNTSKNSRMPVEWFCDTMVRNFLGVCARSGMDIDEVKKEIAERLKVL